MKTFKNLKIGVLEHVTNKKLIPQYEKYPEVYQLVDNENASDVTLDELKQKADSLGIEYPKRITKDKLLELINNADTDIDDNDDNDTEE